MAVADQDADPIFLSSDRLASLSDTMFGVAMTLLATTLIPSVQTLAGSALDMLRAISEPLTAVALSFAISGAYWISQQCRLAMTRSVTLRETRLHLVFLFLIILLPISTSLSGSRALTPSVVTIYGTHLVLIGFVNLLLWIEVHRRAAAHVWVVGSSLLLALFVAALAIGEVHPAIAKDMWFAGFAVPLLSRHLARLVYRT